MRPIRLSILGTCVTRDILAVAPPWLEVASYHARSSLISVMAPPMPLDLSGLAWPHPFARRAVTADFTKSFFADLRAARPDVLILDFIDERYDLLQLGDSFATFSYDLMDAGFRAAGHPGLLVRERDTALVRDLWLERSAAFVRAVRAELPAVRWILHKARWMPGYRSGTSIIPLSPAERAAADSGNRLLADYHRHFERRLGGADTIELPGTYYADAHHRWGATPFHYEQAYVEDALARLEGLLAG